MSDLSQVDTQKMLWSQRFSVESWSLCKLCLGEVDEEGEEALERLQLSEEVSLKRVIKFCYLGI